MAEKEGFEPSRPFRGLHDFQSCALDQLGDFSIAVLVLISVYEASPNATALLLYQSFSQSQAPKTILSKKAESRGSPPCASAHFGNDAVHGMVHGDTQLVDTLSHLRFHGIPAVGHHHSHCRAGHQSGADTDVPRRQVSRSSGSALAVQSLLCGLSVV